jgi:HEAT repeat protein
VQPDQPEPVARRRLSPLQISVSGLAIVVLCCAVILWSYRKFRELAHPSIAQARLLRSGDRDQREEAARFFLAADPVDSTIAAAALIDALGDEDVRVRCEAVRALGVVAKQSMAPSAPPGGARPAIDALVKVLLDRRAETRAPDSANLSRAVGEARGTSSGRRMRTHLPGPAPWADASESRDLAQALDDPSWMAARALGEAAPNSDCAETALAALTTALRTESDERRLRAITRSLARFGPAAGRVVSDLTQALRKAVAAQGKSDLWLWASAETLVQIAPGTSEADEAIEALTDCLHSRDDDEQRIMAIQSLVRLGPTAHPAVPALIDIMKESYTKPEAYVGRHWVPEALGKIAPGTPSEATAIVALAEALDVNDDVLRLGALQALSRFGPAAKIAAPRVEALKNSIPFRHLADQVLKVIDPEH